MKAAFLSRAALLSSLVLAACTQPYTDDQQVDVADGDDALITFPAAAYSGATRIAYGQTLTRRFTSANGFVAVKFNAVKGDQVRFSVSAARDTVSYLVFNQRNVAALRDANDPAGAFRYKIDADGEYFIMMRSKDRAAANITVKLEKLAGVGTPGAFTASELVAAARAGSAPAFRALGKGVLDRLEYRSCVAATGCAPAQRYVTILKNEVSNYYPYFHPTLRQSSGGIAVNFDFDAPPGGVTGVMNFAGLVAKTATNEVTKPGRNLQGVETSVETTRNFDALQSAALTGSIRLSIDEQVAYDEKKAITANYSVTYSRAGAHISLRSEVNRTGATWTEYAGEFDIPFSALPPQSRPVSTPVPRTGDLPRSVSRVALDDEEVISRFPIGAQEMQVFTVAADEASYMSQFETGTYGSRSCGPRTGCTAWTTASDQVQQKWILGGSGFVMGTAARSSIKLRISGNDSYEVVIRRDSSLPEQIIPIVSGVGSFVSDSLDARGARYTVKVTSQGLLFERAFETGTRQPGGAFFAAPNGGDKIFEPGYLTEYYANHSMLIRFDRNWTS